MSISLLIPTYNSEKFISRNISTLYHYLDSEFNDFELIVIDDGSTDKTYEAVSKLISSFGNLKLASLPQNSGKFAALKEGVKLSSKEIILFTDSDLPFELKAISYISHLISNRKIDIVIGDRSLNESIYYTKISKTRLFSTKIFSFLVRILVAGGLFDTQCGLKGFKSNVAKLIFPLLTNNNFSGDVEFLYIALKYNLEIKRIPVRFLNKEASTVNPAIHGLSMLKSIFYLKINWIKGKYTSDALSKLSSQNYWD